MTEHKKSNTTPLVVFLCCCIFRILNLFLVQSQFDPDEYWQGLEPAYCQVFESCDGLTWEWKRRSETTEIRSIRDFIVQGLEGPVRSYVSVLPTLVFYYIVKYAGIDSTWMISRGPLFLNAIVVAAPTDWSVWYMSQWMTVLGSTELNSQLWYTYASLTSWFNAYALVRTYSNSLETCFLALGLCLVSPEFLGNTSRSTILPASVAFFLGGVCCAIRFTCLVCYIPIGIILSMQQRSRSMIHCLLRVCFVPGLCGLIITLLFDRVMYGFWAIPLLGNIHFNVILGNGSLYGTHPFYWYFLAGCPALVGMLLPLLISDLLSTWTYGKRNLWIVAICSTMLHSFSEHKEFRFLLPLLPIFCLLSGEKIVLLSVRKWGKCLLVLGAFINYNIVVYLGLFHQRGVISVNREIVQRVEQKSQTYSIHYLMGCHSTPLLSHLHTPPVKFETWYLDCSPECRTNPSLECESDQFSRDPGQFMKDAYLRRPYPDFLVVRSEDLPKMGAKATKIMNEVARFPNGINGIQFGQDKQADSYNPFGETWHIIGLVALRLDEVVLFQHKKLQQSS